MADEEISEEIRKRLRDTTRPIKNVPFHEIAQAIWSVKVLPVKGMSQDNKVVLEKIKEGLGSICREGKAIKSGRINEVGNKMEGVVKEHLESLGLEVGSPKTKSKKASAIGYPDLIVVTSDEPIYLEIKVSSAGKQKDSGLRTLYFSPSEDPKVWCDAHHLLARIVVAHDVDNELFTPVSFDLVDLHEVICDLKYEFNSSNKRLYAEKHLLPKDKES